MCGVSRVDRGRSEGVRRRVIVEKNMSDRVDLKIFYGLVIFWVIGNKPPAKSPKSVRVVKAPFPHFGGR